MLKVERPNDRVQVAIRDLEANRVRLDRAYTVARAAIGVALSELRQSAELIHVEQAYADKESGTVVERGALVVDLRRMRGSWRHHNLELSRRNLEIVALLASHPDTVRTRDQIIDHLDRDSEIYDRTIDTRIKIIRRAFRAVDPDFEALRTVYSVGYKWRE